MIRGGNYPAVASPVQTADGLVSIQFGESEEKRSIYVMVLCEIVRGPYAGQKLYWRGYFSDTPDKSGKTVAQRTVESLRAFGFTGDEFAGMVTQHPENEVEIVVGVEEYKGQKRNKVQWVNGPIRGIKVENQIVGAKLRQFSAQLAGVLKATPPIAGKKAVREAPSGDAPGPGGTEQAPDGADDWTSVPPPGDDDVPF